MKKGLQKSLRLGVTSSIARRRSRYSPESLVEPRQSFRTNQANDYGKQRGHCVPREESLGLKQCSACDVLPFEVVVVSPVLYQNSLPLLKGRYLKADRWREIRFFRWEGKRACGLGKRKGKGRVRHQRFR